MCFLKKKTPSLIFNLKDLKGNHNLMKEMSMKYKQCTKAADERFWLLWSSTSDSNHNGMTESDLGPPIMTG